MYKVRAELKNLNMKITNQKTKSEKPKEKKLEC
jgi:hypothetical protein